MHLNRIKVFCYLCSKAAVGLPFFYYLQDELLDDSENLQRLFSKIHNIAYTLQSCLRLTYLGKSKECTASLTLLKNLGATDMVSDGLRVRIRLLIDFRQLTRSS